MEVFLVSYEYFWRLSDAFCTLTYIPAGETRFVFRIYWQLTIKTSERRGIIDTVQVSLLLTLNRFRKLIR